MPDVFTGAEISVRVDHAALIARLQRFDQNLEILPMDVLGTLLLGEIDEVIVSQGAKGTDGRWEPFSPRTLKRHPRRIGGTLLQDTGALAAVQVVETGPTKIVIASAPAYSRWHLEGTRKMPKRDFFALNFPRVLEEMGEIVLESLQR